ncbi:MAG: lysylphosphatidylglycerol synthase transmembrane domain-containing protein [Candidatus Acidiferrales bacterium]
MPTPPVTLQPETRSPKRNWPRKTLQVILQYGGSALVLYLLFRLLPGRQVWQALGLLPARLWILVLIGYLAAHCIGAAKYRLVLNLGGAGIGARQAARCYFAGLFGSLFLPSLIGGDILRVAMALRVARSRAGVLLGSLVDRISDFTALALLAAVGAALVPGTLDPRSRKIFELAGGIAVVGIAAAASAIAMLPVRRFSYRMRRRFVRLRGAVHSTIKQPGEMVRALSMSVTVQLIFVVLNVVLANACGLHLRFRVWLFAWPLAKLSAAIPITQAGIGVREAALAALLVPFGATAVLAVASGLAWDAISIGGAIAGGIFTLLSGRSGPGTRSGKGA